MDDKIVSTVTVDGMRLEAVIRPGGLAGRLMFYAYEHDRFLFCVPEVTARAFADFVKSVPVSPVIDNFPATTEISDQN